MKRTLSIVFGALIMTTAFAAISQAAMPEMPELKTVDFNPPLGERLTLKNGIKVYLMLDKTLPVMHVNAIVRTGRFNDPADKTGIGGLTAELLRNGGSQKYSADEIDKQLEFLGASIDSSISTEEANVEMTSLKKDFDTTLDIFAQILMNPTFEESKVKLAKAEALEVIARRNDSPSQAATREALRRFYGPNHPYGARSEAATINAISIADMQKYHKNYYQPGNIMIAIAGDYGSKKEITAKLNKAFGSWKKSKTVFPNIPPVKINEKRQVYHIQKDIAQAYIVILQKSVKRLDPAEYALSVTNEMLGGGLSSRMAAEVRSRKGLAYSVYSYFSKRADYGFEMAYCSTKPETYSQALSEMLNQFSIVAKEKADNDEVKRSKDSIINSFVFRFATPFDLIFNRMSYDYYKYPPEYLENYVKNIEKITPEDVLNVSKKMFNPDEAMIFIIGNSNKFDKPLTEFGPVIELTEAD